MKSVDVAIIGGGVVGLATAYRLSERLPPLKIAILEKENALAQHQSAHNSGVLHSGIYYPPGSLKAKNCREGKLAMQAFCDREGVPYELCGKVIVAVDERELPNLNEIHQRGEANGVCATLIDADRLQEIEPHVRGIRAIHVPEAGIVDFGRACERMAARIRERDGEILLAAKVYGIRHHHQTCVLQSSAGDLEARVVVNCAGLYCDHVTRLSGQRPEAKIIPFRGEYYTLNTAARHLCRNLIYPVPDPNFPFLGVHFTRMISGAVECGPNAVLAFAREGYRKRDIHCGELFESLSYPGFIRLAAKYWRTGCGEMWRSFSKNAFVKALQRLVPEVRPEDLARAPAGVRAQALTAAGQLVDDFLIQDAHRVINLNNAPSPAATASLTIGELLATRTACYLE